jgi:hypothetical protein
MPEVTVVEDDADRRRHSRRLVYRTAELVLRGASDGGVQVEPGVRAAFVAFNDFIHISRTLLELAGEPADLIYPAEQIHALLTEVPYARPLFAIQLDVATDAGSYLQPG